MRRLAGLITLIVPISLYAVTKFPFPHNANYSYGIKPSSINSDVVQASYEDFLNRFYTESGNLARIKFDDQNYTVSEGIGYGMLVMVYMDNAKNNTRDKFDKLWAYYNKFLNERGLMHWKIRGFDGVDQQNAATDAELDVAAALMMAYKQWGDEKYLNDAKNLINKIAAHEVNENGHLKPGDAWDSKKNPSYFSTGAMELFKQASSFDWDKVITNSYNLLKKVRNANTGLVPDWCSESGNPEGDYYYDATRTPWRMAWAYAWYGHSDAKDVASKIATWINGKTNGSAKNIVDGYTLDGGNKSQWNVAAFIGPFACAGMVDQTHQAWLDNAYNHLASFASKTDDSYYNQSLEILTLLLLSGNMPNFWATQQPQTFTLTVSTQPSAGGTVTKNPSASQYNSGATVTIEAAPNNGYRFVNWSGDISGTETQKTITMTKNMNVVANFEALQQKYTITLSAQPANGGTVNKYPTEEQYNSGTYVTVQAVPQDGYRFVNWSGDISGTELSKTFQITANMNITAVFEPNVGVSHNLAGSRSTVLNLQQNSGSLVLEYSTVKAERVSITIHDITGKTVLAPVNGFIPAGRHLMRVRTALNSGIYWIRMRSANGELVRSATITR
jgi:endo-1,4-beta-D-glucanase Y